LRKLPLRCCSSLLEVSADLIEVVTETGSTNTNLAARAAGGEPVVACHWLVTDRQTAGRGRQGRTWNDGVGNFMGSTAVALRAGDPPAHTLSLVAGVAVHAAVEAVAPELPSLCLKWPNDLLIHDVKLAGILLERVGDTIFVGVGVNLVQAPDLPDRETANLASFGYVIERDTFADQLDAMWAQALCLWQAGGWHQLRSDWIARAHPFGTPLQVHGPDGALLSGTFAGLDPEGALQLQLPGGTRRTIHAGEVMLDTRR
jgi:BirA family biotin operon repressor/biotin-[acetyl-CoA-carboxylase] ligase